jgi:hypothetical protein
MMAPPLPRRCVRGAGARPAVEPLFQEQVKDRGQAADGNEAGHALVKGAVIAGRQRIKAGNDKKEQAPAKLLHLLVKKKSEHQSGNQRDWRTEKN